MTMKEALLIVGLLAVLAVPSVLVTQAAAIVRLPTRIKKRILCAQIAGIVGLSVMLACLVAEANR